MIAAGGPRGKYDDRNLRHCTKSVVFLHCSQPLYNRFPKCRELITLTRGSGMTKLCFRTLVVTLSLCILI